MPPGKTLKLVQPGRPADIPSLDRLLNTRAFQSLLTEYGRTQVVAAARAQLAQLRRGVLAKRLEHAELAEDTIASATAARLSEAARTALRPVFNLSGTVLHTNLGRALLPQAAVRAVTQALSAPVDLEFDLDTGRRGERDARIEALLRELTGAPAALVVNNNAAALLLMLGALARGREVLVSRGELIEIGASFRLPDIMRRAGARLVEVGTTNRTHLADYTQALGPRSALLMKVHTSNYVISGFTSAVPLAKLAALGRARRVPVAVDLGSGSLIDLKRWDLPGEPTVREALTAGADLVAFSADKLLGGPQAGLLVGNAELIGRLRRDPLKRALRVGKLTLAALEAVLALYRAPEFLAARLPTLRLLTRRPADMQAQAARLEPLMQRALGGAYQVSAAPTASQIGSGALPLAQLPSHGLAIRAVRAQRASLARLDAALRRLPRPVISRTAERTLWLDLRCLEADDEAAFVQQLGALAP